MTLDPHMKRLIDVLVDVAVRELRNEMAPASVTKPGPNHRVSKEAVNDEYFIQARTDKTA